MQLNNKNWHTVKNIFICLLMCLLAFTIYAYEKKLKDNSFDSLRHNIKVNMLYYINLDSGNVGIKESMLDSSVVYLDSLHKNGYDIDFICEFFAYNKLKNKLFARLKKLNYKDLSKKIMIKCDVGD